MLHFYNLVRVRYNFVKNSWRTQYFPFDSITGFGPFSEIPVHPFRVKLLIITMRTRESMFVDRCVLESFRTFTRSKNQGRIYH